MDTAALSELLRQAGAFSLLADDDRDRVAARFETVRFSLGQTICRAGDDADAFYVVAAGRARVVATHADGQEVTVGTLTQGDHFGEQGLLANSQRQYTVRAAGELTLLRLKRQEFQSLLESAPDLREYFARYAEETSIRNFLKMATVFAPLSPKEIRDLLGSLELREIAAGDAIIREGDAGDAFYILRSGTAKVIKESLGGKVAGRLKPGNSFGELALLLGAPRAASVVAAEPCTVFRLAKPDFDRIIASAPKVKDALVNIAAGYGGDAMHAAEEETADEAGLDAAAPAATEELRDAPATEETYRPKRAHRYPALLQISETDCGAASLSMVLRYYGRRVSINHIRELANVGREGATLYHVAEAAEALGFHARGVRAAYAHLLTMELPAIVHWEGHHYVVLYEAHPDHVVVADPAIGLRRLTQEEFLQGWTGYALLLTPTAKIEAVAESKSTIGRFIPLVLPYKRLLIEIFLASLVIQVFGLATPVFTQLIVDRALVHKNVTMLNVLLGGMLVVAVFQTLTTALRQYLMVHTSRRIDMEMVVSFYQHVLSLPIRYFEERKVGDILKRFSENQRIRDLLTGQAVSITLDCIMVVVYLGVMLYYNAKLALVALAFIPVYVILTLVLTPLMKKQNRELFQRSAQQQSHLVESISGIGTVKAMAAERSVRWAWEGLMVKELNTQFHTAITAMTAQSLGGVVQQLNTMFVTWYGAQLVINGELSVGQLMAFQSLIGQVTGPILKMVNLWEQVQEVNIALERLNEVLDSPPEEDPQRDGLTQLPPLKGHVLFQNVTFAYPSRPEKNALQNINLEILPGQTVALVGRSGAGKSTFANLLLRLHQPTSGKILLDGHDLRQVAASSLRTQVGVVPQSITLFSGTIRGNIALGSPNARMEEIVGAAMLAGAHEFVTGLPSGYETKVGEHGQSLSGGQRQRIAIARALLKKPRILVFDEATSALDTESERAVQKNLETIFKDRTTFIIAHRLSTVRKADVIVVLDQGNIVEVGNHYSLMQQRGLYYYLNGQQLEE